MASIETSPSCLAFIQIIFPKMGTNISENLFGGKNEKEEREREEKRREKREKREEKRERKKRQKPEAEAAPRRKLL